MKLDKDCTTIMKGYGILFIALHNFLHLGSVTKFVHENEFTYSVQRTLDYFDVIRVFDVSDFGQFFSFLGWIGMPVFLFISGYGLVKKYENNSDFNIGKHVFHSWKKLFLLLLPAALFFVMLSFIVGDWKSMVPKTLLQFTLLNNLVIPKIEFSPGVYWYFSLTFEFYLLYILIRRWNVKQLLFLLCGMLVVQVFAICFLGGPTSDIWLWIKHNFIGWGQIFLMGMIIAKTNWDNYLPSNNILLWSLSIVCLCLLFVLQLNVWTWLLFVPFVALLFFVFLSRAVNNIVILKKIGIWLGNYSSYIFVAHPVFRIIVLSLYERFYMPLWLMTLLYTVLFIFGAIIYKPIYQWLMNLKFVKQD